MSFIDTAYLWSSMTRKSEIQNNTTEGMFGVKYVVSVACAVYLYMVEIDPKENKRKTVPWFIKIAHPLSLLEAKEASVAISKQLFT